MVLALVGPETHKRNCRGKPAIISAPSIVVPKINKAPVSSSSPSKAVKKIDKPPLDLKSSKAVERVRRWREKNRERYNETMRNYRSKK